MKRQRRGAEKRLGGPQIWGVMWLVASGLAACGGRATQNLDGSLSPSATGTPSNSRGGAASQAAGGAASSGGRTAAGGADAGGGPARPVACPTLPEAESGTSSVKAAWQTVEGVGQGGLVAVAVDDSGVYWFDASFALHALRAGEPESILRPAKPGIGVGSLIATPDRLVWSEQSTDSGVNQLEAIPKAGGAERVLTENEQTLVEPFGFDASSVYAVLGQGEAVDLLELNEGATSQLKLPHPNVPFALRDGGVFLWDQAASVRRLDLGTYQLAQVGSVGGVPQAVTDRYAISVVHDDRHGGDPIDKLQLLELESGCILAMPYLESEIAQPLVADEAHVYWLTKSAPAELLRIAVATGSIEPLLLQDVRVPLQELVGADSTALYLRAGSQLLRVEKP